MPGDESYRRSGFFDLFAERHALAQLLVGGKVVLDTCAGTAWGTREFFLPKASLVVATDRSLEALTHYGFRDISAVVCDALSLSWRAERFDLVVALESIEHLAREDGSLYVAEMGRVVKRDGVVVGSTPICPHDGLIPFFREQNPYHLYAYTHRELATKLNAVFAETFIAPRWNETNPYWIFMAAHTPGRLHKADAEAFIRAVRSDTPEKRAIRVQWLRVWSDELDRRGQRVAAREVLARARGESPRDPGVWKAFVRLHVPRRLWQGMRQLAGRC